MQTAGQQRGKRQSGFVPEGGKGLHALLAPLAKIGPLDEDFARFARLSDDEAAAELRAVIYDLPELRRPFAVRVLMQLMRSMLNGAGWPWME